MKFILKKYIHWTWGWNLDSALRYAKAVSIIRERKPETVVEVGSGSRGISPYANYPSYGVDLHFDDSISSDLQVRVVSSGTHLPFENASSDITVCTDMLEHIVAEERPKVISELFRITKIDGLIYISFPTGEDAEAADREIYDIYYKYRGKEYSLLKEHIANGLPDAKDIKEMLVPFANERDWDIQNFPNTPLWLWRLCQMLFAIFPIIGLLQRPLGKILYYLFKNHQHKTNYRQIFICSQRINKRNV